MAQNNRNNSLLDPLFVGIIFHDNFSSLVDFNSRIHLMNIFASMLMNYCQLKEMVQTIPNDRLQQVRIVVGVMKMDLK